MRALADGERFVVTSNGIPVGELAPIRPRRFVDATATVAAFRGAPKLDAVRFRTDVDDALDQSVVPRG